MAQIQFYRGLKKFYSQDKYLDALYFATDSKQIIVNGIAYGFDSSDPDMDLISIVQFIKPDTIKFVASNGNETIVTFPVVTQSESGLMSASDKTTLDNIPNVYATKQDVAQAMVGVYHYRGVVDTLEDLPSEGLKEGDVYRIREAFELDGQPYAKGTHVVWNGIAWKAMEGEEPGYSKQEADDKFIAWAKETNGNKVVLLPKGSKVIGTMVGEDGLDDGASILQLGVYEDGAVQQTEVGSTKLHLKLNSNDRPTVEFADKSKENLAFLKDISESGVYNLGEFNTSGEAENEAAVIGVYDVLNNAILKYTTKDGNNGIIINNISGNSAFQTLHFKGSIYTRTVTKENEIVTKTDWEPVSTVILTNKSAVGALLFKLTTSSSQEDIKAALTDPYTRQIVTLDDLNKCFKYGYYLKDSLFGSKINVGWTGSAFILTEVHSMAPTKNPSVSTITLNVDEEGTFTVVKDGFSSQIITSVDLTWNEVTQ